MSTGWRNPRTVNCVAAASQDSELLAVPKLPYLEHDESFSGLDGCTDRASVGRMGKNWIFHLNDRS